MKSYIIIALALILSFGCQESKTDHFKMGEEILASNTNNRDEIAKAINLFQAELKENPNSIEALKSLAKVYGKISENDRSIYEFSKAITENNKITGDLLIQRGMQYFITKDYDASLNDFNKSLKYLPENDRIYKLIFTSKLWQKYNIDGNWAKFDKSDAQSIIDEIYPDNLSKPTINELIEIAKAN